MNAAGRGGESSWSDLLSSKEARWTSNWACTDQIVSSLDVTAERRARILQLIVAGGGSPTVPGPICRVAAEVTRVTGAGVIVLTDDAPQASLCATDEVATLIEELHFSLGEGPCIDAHRMSSVVLEPDLTSPAATRWPAFSRRAVDAGARAIFAFPIHLETARLGALGLYRTEPGALDNEQQAEAIVMADVIARTLLTLQADAPPGSVPDQLDTELHVVVNQAAGMMSVQLDVSVEEALVRLRARAFCTDRPLADVAREVIDQPLHFRAEEH
jgi:hypothetical protein